MDHSLLFLGTSDGRSRWRRAHASMLLSFGDARILLDCGEPCSRALYDRGLIPDGFDKIFLSHLHADHVGGLPMLVQNLWLAKRRRPMPLFMPREGIAPLRKWLRACYLCENLLRFRLEARPWRAGEVLRWNRLRVRPIRNRHLDGFRRICKGRGGFESFSFRFESGKRTLVWSADLGSPEDLAPLLEKPTQTLVCELAHFSPESLFRFLAPRKVARLILTHLGRATMERPAAVRRLAAKMLPGREVLFARDGLRVALP
ncbi:MAG: ribonuclease Z [Verrucomicrobiae bacterium]|nr:ribonuclease Z [Verrucomicrobiae bacterium]